MLHAAPFSCFSPERVGRCGKGPVGSTKGRRWMSRRKMGPNLVTPKSREARMSRGPQQDAHSVPEAGDLAADLGLPELRTLRWNVEARSLPEFLCTQKTSNSGAPGWLRRLSLGHDLVVRGFEAHVGVCADSSEPGACFGFCVSFSTSLCPCPSHALFLSLKNKN